MTLRELLPGRDDGVVRELLAFSVGSTDAATIEQCRARYFRAPGWRLLGYEVDGRVVGSIGLELVAGDAGVIRHIAVLPAHRGVGIGREMVRLACERFALRRLSAETDREAVGFYRSCGFVVTRLGERYPGVERFRCVWGALPGDAARPESAGV